MLSSQDASTRGYLDRVKLIRKKGDAEAVIKLMADIDADWGARKDAAYYYVVAELCGAVGSWPALDPNRTDLVRKLATTAIDAPGDKPIYSEVRLLLFLQGDPDYIHRKLVGADWEKERLIRVRRWLTTWQHLGLAKNQLPPASGELLESVDPPKGVKGVTFPGMAPELIKDPVLRKQYEEAIANNNEKHRINRMRGDVENTEAAFVKPATRYIINAYSAPPYQTEELEKTLEEYGVDKKSRTIMLAEVRRRVAEKIEFDEIVAKKSGTFKDPLVPPPTTDGANKPSKESEEKATKVPPSESVTAAESPTSYQTLILIVLGALAAMVAGLGLWWWGAQREKRRE